MKMSSSASSMLRRFIVIPFIVMFCLWTGCGLIAFSFSSRSRACTAEQQCSGVREVILLGKALNNHLQFPDAPPALKWASTTDMINTRELSSVATLEQAEAKASNSTDSVEDESTRSSMVQELHSLGYNEIEQVVDNKFQTTTGDSETTDEVHAAVAGSNLDTEVSVSLTSENYNDMNASLNSSHERFATTFEQTIAEEKEEEEEEKKIIGEGQQRIMKDLRSYSTAITEKMDICKGRYVYSYKLPSKFNKDLLASCETIIPYYSMCEYFSNSGLGKQVSGNRAEGILKPLNRWHQTHQYTLDLIFDARLQNYPCRTHDPNKATLFHIPYYGGIDVLRYHFLNVTHSQKDELGNEMVAWLNGQKWWQRYGGNDHFLVLGKITWDFRRGTIDWGNTLLRNPALHNVTRLLLERDPWEPNDISVPHPTYFHPNSDQDMDTWLSHVESTKRDRLVSFAGMPRTTDNIRTILITMCQDNPILCRYLECSGEVCFRPETTTNLFLHSHFCLQPVGDSATRRSVFDSLIAGCIPVLLSTDTAYVQYPWHLPSHPISYSIFISSDQVKNGTVDVIRTLASISKHKRAQMRNNIIHTLIPRLVYASTGANLTRYSDAFDVAMSSLLEKASRSARE